jgi:16S rRNA (uracil1498-N3)-methyltransferase
MHRFYLPPEQCQGEFVTLEGREAHHALHVVRLRRHESVLLLDGQGVSYSCEVVETGRRHVRLRLLKQHRSPAPTRQIVLLQAIPKAKAMEWIIQKATELGATRLVPLLTERSLAHPSLEETKREKWFWTAIDAIKQCGSVWLPTLDAPTAPRTCLESGSALELALLASLESSLHPRRCFEKFWEDHGRFPDSLGLWIGPEGDFTPDELEMITASGAHPVSFGSRVLRAETAAVYGLSILNYELQA